MTGYGNSLYGPNDNITREQLAVILYRYAGSPSVRDFVNTPFFDYYDYDKISPYARDAVYWAVNTGVLYTSGRNNIAPQQDATRAEVAWAIQKLVEYLAE